MVSDSTQHLKSSHIITVQCARKRTDSFLLEGGRPKQRRKVICGESTLGLHICEVTRFQTGLLCYVTFVLSCRKMQIRATFMFNCVKSKARPNTSRVQVEAKPSQCLSSAIATTGCKFVKLLLILYWSLYYTYIGQYPSTAYKSNVDHCVISSQLDIQQLPRQFPHN